MIFPLFWRIILYNPSGPVSNQSQNQPPVIQQQFGSEGQCQFDEEDYDCDEEFGFECIPLQSVCNEEDSNDDIYFLDEFGNYVFPVSSSPNNVQGSCSCPPSAEELNSTLRRVSQVRDKYLPWEYCYHLIAISGQFCVHCEKSSWRLSLHPCAGIESATPECSIPAFC